MKITVNIDKKHYKGLKAIADANDRTIEDIVEKYLIYLYERDILKGYSKLKIGRQEAMDALGIDWYGDLLDKLSEYRLPLPRLPKKETEAMVKRFVELLPEPEKKAQGRKKKGSIKT